MGIFNENDLIFKNYRKSIVEKGYSFPETHNPRAYIGGSMVEEIEYIRETIVPLIKSGNIIDALKLFRTIPGHDTMTKEK